MIATIGCFRGGPAIVPPPNMSAVDEHGLAHRPQPDRSDLDTLPALTHPLEDPETGEPLRFMMLPAGLKANANPRAWEYIVLHHTATDSGDVETIDEEHRQRKDALGNPWLGIGYHFVVGNGNGMADGVVEPTFRWRQQIHGAHAGEKAYNDAGIGICLVGNFVDGHPTQRQIAATRELVDLLSDTFDIAPDNIVRHEDVTATDCPGPNFPFEEIVGHPPAPPKMTMKPFVSEGQTHVEIQR